MTEQEEPGGTEREIEFRGRKIWVHMPTPEQLLVWQRTVKRLGNAEEVVTWNGEQAMAALERARKIIDSLIVHETDKDWLDDEFLSGTFGLREAAPIIQLSLEAFNSNNRAARRTAAQKALPAKKAARKVPATLSKKAAK